MVWPRRGGSCEGCGSCDGCEGCGSCEVVGVVRVVGGVRIVRVVGVVEVGMLWALQELMKFNVPLNYLRDRQALK